uniref:Major facilitator superfamily (MFS) profile domain-containing protein n=1 Tax=Fagus sylvatica TaxID=28930 RepID=A0A2N9HJ67_FAGSY
MGTTTKSMESTSTTTRSMNLQTCLVDILAIEMIRKPVSLEMVLKDHEEMVGIGSKRNGWRVIPLEVVYKGKEDGNQGMAKEKKWSIEELCLEEAMAVGLAITSEVGKYNGKMTPFVVLSCMIVATGGVIFGYDIGISGGVTSMEPFLKKFFPEVYTKMNEDTKISNYCKFDSQLLTSFTSSLYIAGLVASLFASSITRAFGRKPSILTGGVAFLAGSALGGAALNVYMLIFGRILLGIGIGFANLVPLYLSEMAPPNYRGATNIGFQLCVGIGVLSANLINFGTEKIKGGWGWRISLAMAAVPASILTLGALFLPETPNSLIQNNKDHEKAKLMLQRVRGTNDVQAELDDLIKASSISKTIKHPFKNILQRNTKRGAWVCGWKVVVVDSVARLADLGLGLQISAWWWLIWWLGLPISAWVCRSRPRLADLFLLSSGVVVVNGVVVVGLPISSWACQRGG